MSTLVRPSFHALTLLCTACMCLVVAHTVNTVVDTWAQPLPSALEQTSREALTPREELPTPLALAPLGRYLGLPDKLRQEVLPEGPGDPIVPTSLGLKLLGTLVTAQPSTSFASVYESPTRRTRSVWAGDELLGARVLIIERTRVLLLNGERLESIGPESAPSAGGVSPERTPPPPGTSIRQVGPSAYELSRREVNDSTANVHQLATQVRIVPAFKDGAPNGFKLFSIRPDSLFARLGLRNGDVLQRINGLSLSSPDRALEAYSRLRDASRIELEVERQGEVIRQTYTVQD
jgi:general secretion pathway protein C